ncbi:MAG TPA: biotin/lipoyl-binding protein [Gemmata sp.]|nr:biotin/lipoyl-binding protein [Gemmata sp.]
MLTRYLLPLLAVASFTFAVIQMTKAQQVPPPASPPVDPGRSPFGRQVAGSAIVEPETENIAVGSHLPGVVKAVHVRVGQRVKAGNPLFELDDRQLRAELAARRATLESERAKVTKLEMMPRKEELPPLRALVASAEANLADKVAMYDRVRASTSVISAEERDNRKAAVDVARAQLEKATADLKLAESGAWRYDTSVAAAAVAQAQAMVGQAETELERLSVQAPRVRKPETDPSRLPVADADLVEFKVLQVNVRPGEAVGTAPGTPLVVLGTVGRLHARVDIDENDIARFRPGIKGVAAPRGNPSSQYPISFVRVEPYVIPKKSLTGGNTERVDTRVLQVIYAIDDPNAALYVGQQLDVSLDASK